MTIRAACFAVRRVFRPFVRDERGVILSLVSVMIAVLLGLAGLAFEPGLWYMFRRYDQSAADVAALSGALERQPASPTRTSVPSPDPRLG